MLTKLIAYEWKTTARVLLPISGGVLVFSLMTGFMNLLLDRPGLPAPLEWLQSMVLFIAGLALLVVLGACVFLNIQRFYKLLGQQGYLMLSLPVPVWQHMAAKLICACGWSVLCVPYAFICVLLTSMDFSGFWPDWNAASMDPTLIPVTLLVILLMLSAVASGYLHTYLCCAVGAQFGQQRLLASIVSYFVLGFVEQVAGTLALILLVNAAAESYTITGWMQALSHNMVGSMILLLVGLLVVLLLFCALLWAIVQWLMTRRLNLV